jgi:hypothetical protein
MKTIAAWLESSKSPQKIDLQATKRARITLTIWVAIGLPASMPLPAEIEQNKWPRGVPASACG